VQSRINGTITVEKFLGKNRITVGGCWQSGEHAERITKAMLQTVPQPAERIKNILVLGVGGGSMINVINLFYPKAHITGIEIDPVMIAMGKKYLHLSKASSLDIVIEDAREFVKTWKRSTFDLIFLDLYVGCEEPAFLVTKDFLTNIQKIVGKKGSFVCNASNLPVNKRRTEMLIVQLRQTFAKVAVFHLPPNVIICAS